MNIAKVILHLLIISPAFSAKYPIDVYGVDLKTGNAIIERFQNKIEKYIKLDEVLQLHPEKLNNISNEYLTLRDTLSKKIKDYGNFETVSLSTIRYSDGKLFTTIDVVTSSQKYRLPSNIHRSINPHFVLNQNSQDLFKRWKDYNHKNFNLYVKQKINPNLKSCPSTYCSWGYTKEELIRYYPKFKDFANNHSLELKSIIEHSRDEALRGDAVLILAHSDDIKSVSHYLSQYIHDEHPTVRNNVMLVISSFIEKNKNLHLPIEPFLKALDYPLTTDRNKAALVLQHIADKDATSHKVIAQKAGTTLINLLKLKQPNNHNASLQILKTISHQNYAEHDYQKWEDWVKSQRQSR